MPSLTGVTSLHSGVASLLHGERDRLSRLINAKERFRVGSGGEEGKGKGVGGIGRRINSVFNLG